MALHTGHPQTAGPLGDEDHLGEILVRLLPLPSLIVRASAFSGQRGRLVTDQAFFRILDAPIRSLMPPCRVLVINRDLTLLLLFAPVTRGLRGVVIPLDFVDGEYVIYNGAVLCAVADVQGHLHGDYHSGPFNVVLVATRWRHPVLARVYSLETGEGEIFP
ncbi:uncharacterized protein [Aegilops tauschii subsp. strangulata]|uniref:uncharacterized protein n=1 Tax=Aegilops tauschii subsp. strangulata TaxID=200361 RepID=UPI00098B702B